MLGRMTVGSDEGTNPGQRIEDTTQPGMPLGEEGDETPTDEHAALGDTEESTDEHAALDEGAAPADGGTSATKQ